jgi:putative two-component system response regulator
MNDSTNTTANIMIVDDTPANLELLSDMLKKRGYQVRPAPSGQLAIQAAKNNPPDIFLLDIAMPDMNGYELCKILKEDEKLGDIPVIFISALTNAEQKVEAFSSGGVDYVTKPFNFEEVAARVATHLKLHRLQLEKEEYNEKLEAVVEEQARTILDSQMAIIFAIAKLAESRDDDTGKHLERIQITARALALNHGKKPEYNSIITRAYAENLFHASPLHDIGKVAIPDNILLKPGKLTSEEFEIMKTHTLLGAETLKEVLNKSPENRFIKMGIAIARHHHEKWDGTGYPDGLSGANIPLSARIMSVADVYDAVRSKRCYKPAFSHDDTREIILKGKGTQFDPDIIDTFENIHEEIKSIYESLVDC